MQILERDAVFVQFAQQRRDAALLALRVEGVNQRIAGLLKELDDAGIRFKDLHTTQSSLEDIFVSLVRETPAADSRTRAGA